MRTIEYHPISALGVVRAHDSVEDFAAAMVKAGAITPEGSLSVGQLAALVDIERRGIYNKLNRPGFVAVDNGPVSAKTYYYLFNEGFGELARSQGHTYYPEHLGPLVSSFPNIPKKVEYSEKRRFSNMDVVGTISSADMEDESPLLIRAVGISDTTLLEGTLGPQMMRMMEEIFKNPLANEARLENALVLLSGVKRWAQRVRTYDAEKQAYIQQQFVNQGE